MRHLLDVIDSGAYDVPLFIILVVGLAGLWLREKMLKRRALAKVLCEAAKYDFFEAKDRATKSFEVFGPRHPTTHFDVLDAISCWEVWQGKPFNRVRIETATPIEWEVISLFNSLGDEETRVTM